jgi:glycosyltransferase involved in cell wall biosynthesis
MNIPDQSILKEYNLEQFGYHILVARIEPENSLEVILDGIVKSNTKTPILVIGNPSNKYGKYLISKYKNQPGIIFQGAVYDINKLNNLRHYSALYFHGHTVGGTNPSLLEAMASGSLICANDNVFNRHILGEDAYYFRTSDEISKLLNDISFRSEHHLKMVNRNIIKIKEKYNWEKIVKLYEEHFFDILKDGKT